MKQKEFKECKVCGTEFKMYRTTDKYCSGKCQMKDKKPNLQLKSLYKPIKQISEKRKLEDIIYKSERIKFLSLPENQICFIEGCNKQATTIEHRAGRWGSNYLDTNTWAPCCLEHNLELENNPELSKKYQFSKITGKPKQ